MKIDASVPMHVARAYGLKLVRAPQESAPSNAAMPTEAPQRGSAPPAMKVNTLVAGEVSGSVTFSATAPRASGPTDVLQLYSRAADRIEAATAVQVGRQIDVKA